MSEYLQAIVLGIIQGLTEFLPVSSSGHLELAKCILGSDTTGEQSLLMTVVLHFATAIATIYVFRKDIMVLLSQLFERRRNEGHAFALKILVSLLPAAMVGLLFEDLIESMFSGQLLLVGLALITTAALLILADRARRTDRTVSYLNAFVVGISQMIAIIPGISRSGATIATAVLLKIDRDRAARFSFLMVIPLIFGKIAKDLLSGELLLAEDPGALVAGFIAALVTGILACIWMLQLVRQAKLRFFGIYCILVGFLSISLSMGLFSNA